MSLSNEGKKGGERLREEGLDKVRIKLSQGEYNNEGEFTKNYIREWIKIEEQKRLLLPANISNIIAISAVIISLISVVANIIIIKLGCF